MITAPPSIALAWVSNSSLMARLSDARQNPVRTNLSRLAALANGTQTEGVCVKDQSEHVADFVWDERGCKEWEKRENGS